MRYNFLPSFARRKGRITKLQETNLSFLADYSLDDPNTLNNDPSFDKIALEIGFGNGEDFFSFAKEKTNNNDFIKIIDLMTKYNVKQDCVKKAKHFSTMAKDSLGIFSDSVEKEKLLNLVDYLTLRTR